MNRAYLKPVAKIVFCLVVLVVIILLAADQRADCAAVGGHLERTGRTTNHCVDEHGKELNP